MPERTHPVGFERGRALCAILVSLLPKGRCHIMAKQIASRHGWELWRQLTVHFEPSIASRGLALLESLLNPDLGHNLEEFENRLLTWELNVAEYEAATGKEFDEEIRRATLLKNVPGQVKEFMTLNVQELDRYQKMRDVVFRYPLTKRVWTGGASSYFGGGDGGPSPMEVDAVKGSKNKSKGKGEKERKE